MSQININFRMDENLKKQMEQTCDEMGITMTTAFTIFAKRVVSEKGIPFEVTADPFFSQSNLDHLRRGVLALNAGLGVEHQLIDE